MLGSELLRVEGLAPDGDLPLRNQTWVGAYIIGDFDMASTDSSWELSCESLAELNDVGFTFAQIADLINYFL